MPDLLAQRPTLTRAAADVALAAAEAEAASRGLAMSVAVVDAAGYLLAFGRHDDALLVTIDAAVAKARTAAHTRLPTRLLQELVDAGQPSLLAITQLTPAIGGMPVLAGKLALGGVGASGGTLDDDEAVARAGADALDRALSGQTPAR